MEVEVTGFSENLKLVLKDCASRGIITADVLQLAIAGLNNIDGSAFPQDSVKTRAGILRKVSRKGRITVLNISSYTNSGEDSFNEVEWESAPLDNDIFIMRQLSTGQNITIEFSTGVNISGQTADYRIGPDGGYVMMQWNALAGKLVKLITSNAVNGVQPAETTTILSGVAEITPSDSPIRFVGIQSERTASTSASQTWQVTAAGTNGSVELLFDNGADGPVRFAYAEWIGTPTFLQIVDDLRDSAIAINAFPGFNTTDNDGVDLLTARVSPNTGAGANGWGFTEVLTGGITSVMGGSTFAVGVDGSDQDDDLEYLLDVPVGQLIVLENIMAANTITVKDTGNFADTDFVIPPRDIVFAIKNADDVIKLTRCCRPYRATTTVDPLGTATAIRGWPFSRPFPTIRAAVQASQIGDDINILASGNLTPYNERDLLYISYLSQHYAASAYIEYTGADEGGIWDDSATGAASQLEGIVLNFAKPGDTEAYGIGAYIQNMGSHVGGDVGVFKITQANTHVIVDGGRFVGKDYTVKVEDGILEIRNAQIWTNNIAGCFGVDISNGVCRLVNCQIIGNTNGIPIRRTGGKLVLDHCLIYNAWNNASGHGIFDDAAAGAGEIVFIGSRIVTTHASSNSVNCTNDQDYITQPAPFFKYAVGGAGTITYLVGGSPTVDSNVTT